VGVVIAINKRVGEWVEPGTELLEIVRIDRLRIEGFVKASAISKPLVGKQASVTVLKGDEERKLQGKVVFVSPDANPVNGQVRVYLEIDNRMREFRPGMRVNATIATDPPQAVTANVPDQGSASP
jgi:multidrug efflux pump subunit AcrA (membrane-fusion protein)